MGKRSKIRKAVEANPEAFQKQYWHNDKKHVLGAKFTKDGEVVPEQYSWGSSYKRYVESVLKRMS